jgi:starch phosphorylase
MNRDEMEANQLYTLLEEKIVPEFYDRGPDGVPKGWIGKVRASMSRMMPRFSSHRMLREYVENAYIPAAKAYRSRSSNGARLAWELEAWNSRLERGWNGIGFGDMNVKEEEGRFWRFDVQVYLGEIDPRDVAVEIYAESEGGQASTKVRMTLNEPISRSSDGCIYTCRVPSERSASDYTQGSSPIIPMHMCQ